MIFQDRTSSVGTGCQIRSILDKIEVFSHLCQIPIYRSHNKFLVLPGVIFGLAQTDDLMDRQIVTALGKLRKYVHSI